MTAIPAGTPVISKKRQFGFFIPLFLGSTAIIGFFGFNLGIFPILVLGWFQPELFGVHQIHEFATAVLFSMLLIGMAIQFYHPERQIAAMQQAVIIGFIAFTFTFLTRGFDPLATFFLVFPLVGAILHPVRRELLRLPGQINGWLVGVSGALAVGSLPYVVAHLQLQSAAVPGDAHAELHHWFTMAALAASLAALGLLAALHSKGWRVTVYSTGIGALIIGLACVRYPYLPSSLGVASGLFIAGWGLAVIILAEWKQQRLPAG